MKLVIEVKEEDYKRYKEDKVCSYASAVLDAVPLNEVLDKIRAEIANELLNAENESRYTQDDIDCGISVGLKRALDTIDKYIGKESE